MYKKPDSDGEREKENLNAIIMMMVLKRRLNSFSVHYKAPLFTGSQACVVNAIKTALASYSLQ